MTMKECRRPSSVDWPSAICVAAELCHSWCTSSCKRTLEPIKSTIKDYCRSAARYLRAMFLDITVFCNTTPYILIECSELDPVDRAKMFLQNAGNYLPPFSSHIPEDDSYNLKKWPLWLPENSVCLLLQATTRWLSDCKSGSLLQLACLRSPEVSWPKLK